MTEHLVNHGLHSNGREWDVKLALLSFMQAKKIDITVSTHFLPSLEEDIVNRKAEVKHTAVNA
jgi:hypothetical protein